MIMHFNLLLLAVSTVAANNQNQCKNVGETALQTILLTELSCNASNAQAVSKGPIDWCDDIAMKWCAGDGNHAEAHWKDSMIYKTILAHCPNELPSKRQQNFVSDLIDKCPKIVKAIIRSGEVEAEAVSAGPGVRGSISGALATDQDQAAEVRDSDSGFLECVKSGEECTSDSQCCIGFCSARLKCEECKTVDEFCLSNSECCSGHCSVRFKCECLARRKYCDSNSECCSGNCGRGWGSFFSTYC